jgi:hypothetical protein
MSSDVNVIVVLRKARLSTGNQLVHVVSCDMQSIGVFPEKLRIWLQIDATEI